MFRPADLLRTIRVNKFTPVEQYYPTHDRGCRVIVSAYQEWRCYLEGLDSPTCPHSPKPHATAAAITLGGKLGGWDILANFRPNVVYVEGRCRPTAVLSRQPHESLPALPKRPPGGVMRRCYQVTPTAG